jgi:integrase
MLVCELREGAVKALGENNLGKFPFLFPGDREGKPLRDLKRAWKVICAAAGIQGVRIHDLRHTYASHLVSSGHSLPLVGRLLGHTQAATTQRYAHLADDPLRQATEKFAQIYSGAGRAHSDERLKAAVIPIKKAGR